MFKVNSFEIGYGFITIWSNEYNKMREHGKDIYKQLPKKVQQINYPHLWFHSPPLFHPYGRGPDVGRKAYKHMHVLYPYQPGEEDVALLRQILNHSIAPVEILEDHVAPNVDMKLSLEQSKEIYNRVIRSIKEKNKKGLLK